MPTRPPAAVGEAVDEVLARPAYSDLRPTVSERIWQSVQDLWLQGLEALAGSGRGSLVGAVVLAGSLAFVLWLSVRLLARTSRDPARRSGLDAELGRSSAAWLEEAASHCAAGRWRQALRCHYRSSLAQLAERGLLDEQPGRTTGEYLERVRRVAPQVAPAFAALTEAFDAVWYGAAPVDASEVTRAAQLAARIQHAGSETVGDPA